MGNNRVLHVSKTANGGRFIGFQIPHLMEAGIEVHLAAPGEGVLTSMAKEAGAILHIVPALASRGPLKAARQLSELIDELAPHVVHTHFVHSTLSARFARHWTKVDFVNLFQVPGPLHLEQWWSRTLDLRTAGPRDEWGAACIWSRNRYLRSGIPEDRVRLAYYGKNLSDYRSDAYPSGILREGLGFGKNDFIATMVSHVYKPRILRRRGIKGHEDFIVAIAKAREIDPDVKGLIVGGPRPGAEGYYRRIIRRSRALNGTAVKFVGPRQDVPDIYRATDVAVHPSLSENIGGAGESLLMAVPTISTNVGGFPDAVKHGDTGLTVHPRAPQQLAEAILFTKKNPLAMKRAARNGREHMRILGNSRVNAETILRAYAEMGVRLG